MVNNNEEINVTDLLSQLALINEQKLLDLWRTNSNFKEHVMEYFELNPKEK